MNISNSYPSGVNTSPSFSTALILTSLLAAACPAGAGIDTSHQATVLYNKDISISVSNSLTSINTPSDEDIVQGLAAIHEMLLSQNENLETELQALIYDNIEELYA